MKLGYANTDYPGFQKKAHYSVSSVEIDACFGNVEVTIRRKLGKAGGNPLYETYQYRLTDASAQRLQKVLSEYKSPYVELTGRGVFLRYEI